ncbi:hypothetical protein AZL_c00020 (plasmid) [Azospirillum sp. B510]|uniref:helix-turn-helix domain-containing protein n=1 Tax=Azospirillum sp. (strain B510) TaxID=137722 RepID=UPI0001C4CAB0|nr:helix-turn-helix domain-containing protein [Azospirillum sp. B510]BAI75295.1 hypothetical protein AZL_c00020 [Azospirillum sp. B510]
MTDTRTSPNRGGQNRWGRIPAWWLDHPELDADGLAVLAALSTYADEAGVCWPSQATLADKLKRSRPTVNRILGRLESLGLVDIEHRRSANGGRLSCRYRLVLTVSAQEGPGAGMDIPGDSAMDSPCSPMSQKQPESEHISQTHAPRPGGKKPVYAEPVPTDWSPSAVDRRWAATRFPGVDVTAHAERFVQQCLAHGYRYRDPAAAWRSWLLKDADHMEQQPAARSHRSNTRKTMTIPRSATDGVAIAEQRLSAWASVAMRLDSGPSATAATPWGIA